MKKLLTLLAAAWLANPTATLAASYEKPWANGRLQVSANSRYLQFANGKPFFWLGDTGWLLPQHLDRDEAKYYLNKCRMAGYNLVQVQVLSMDGFPCVNVYGQESLPYGWDLAKADPEGVYSYWDHLDYIVKTAEQNGIYVALVAVWGYHVKNGLMDVEQAKAFGRFLAERYKKSPNIVWVMGGDIQGDVKPEVWEALATSIKSVDKGHLMTYHPRGRYTSARWWSKAEWIDLHTFQSGHRRYGQRMGNKDYPIPDGTEEDNWMYVDSTWAHKPLKPVLDSEPSYEGIPIGLHDPTEGRWQAHDVRRYAYWSVFAGSCGHTYGHNAIMQMLKPGYHTGYGTDGKETTWVEALEAPGFNQMKHLKNLMLALPYFDRVPDQTVIAGQNGVRYDRLIATRGTDYLMIYDYSGVPIRADLTKASGKKKNAWWMDASTGSLTYLGERSGKLMDYTPGKPHEGICDGVLIIIDAEKDYLLKDQRQIADRSLADAKRDLNE